MATNLQDAYLYIAYGKSRDYYAKEFDAQQKQNLQNAQNLAQQPSSGKLDIAKRLGMTLYTSPIFQNFASKSLPSGVLGRLNSGLYDIMADGKISLMEVADDFIRNTTNILDGVALDLGFPSVSSLYNAIKPDGTGIFSKDINNTALTFIKSFSKNSQKQNQNIENKENEKLNENNEIIKFKLVTQDSETWSTNAPERKTESGLSLITVLGNENIEKKCTVSIINGSDNTFMYDIKNKLKELRDKRESFDVYIVDKDVNYNYTLSNCVFTNVSTDTEGKNSLTINMSFLQIPEYSVTYQKVSSSSSSGNNNSKSGISKNKSSKSGVGKSNKKDAIKTSPKEQVNSSKKIYLDPYSSTYCNKRLDTMRDCQKQLKLMEIHNTLDEKSFQNINYKYENAMRQLLDTGNGSLEMNKSLTTKTRLTREIVVKMVNDPNFNFTYMKK